MVEEIRKIVKEHGRLPVDVDELAVDADLYQAGMTSHASVNVMLALEDAFDVEFPDRMLTPRRVRERRRNRRRPDRVASRGGRMSIAVDRDQAFLDAVSRIADEVAAPNADEVDRDARFPRESIDALREERALSALRARASWAAAGSRSRRSPARASSSGAAAAPARWSSRCTRSRW